MLHYKDLMSAWQERKVAADRRQPARPFRLRRLPAGSAGGAGDQAAESTGG